MCTSPLVRYRAKKQDAGTFLASCSQWMIKSAKELQSHFKSYNLYLSYMNEYMDYQYIPCRKCEECKGKYATDWSLRCYHESQMHEFNSFITLTIDSSKVKDYYENGMKNYCKRCVKGNRFIKYPIDYTLSKGLILDFIKKLRDLLYKRYGITIRYFGCGEYGSGNNHSGYERPHYHILIFGYNFPDRQYYMCSDKGYPLYLSEELSDCWKLGLATVQDVDHSVCMYTAKYCQKKMHFDNNQREFEYYYGRYPEFLFMSKGNCQANRCPFIDDIINNCKGLNSLRNLDNPYCKYCNKTRGGLGYSWFLRYKTDVLKRGYIVAEGKKYPIPKYYISLTKLTNLNLYDNYKINNLIRCEEKFDEHPEEMSTDRLNVRKKCNLSRIKCSSRSL